MNVSDSIDFDVQATISDAATDLASWDVIPAPETTTDDSRLSEWKNRKKCAGVAFVKSIIQKYEEIPEAEGMHVLRNVYDLETGGTSTSAGNVVLRNLTEAFWNRAIEIVETPNKRYRVCAVGTPGIGKSITTSILIRLLLQNKRTVLYRIWTERQDGCVYEFKPTRSNNENESLFVQVDAIAEKDFGIDLADDPSIYYIVDSGATKENCCPNLEYRGKFILVSSPDERHWGGSAFTKAKRDCWGTFLYYPVWSLAELLGARPHIRQTMSTEEVIRRYRQVGGVPRHVFADPEVYEGTLTSQSIAVNNLTQVQVQCIATKELDLVQTMSDTQPKSLIMGFGLSGDKFQHINPVLISDAVSELIFSKHISDLWLMITAPGVDRGDNGWHVFEAFCRYIMAGPSSYMSTYRVCTEKRARTKDSQNLTVPLGACESIRIVLKGDIIEAAKSTPMVVFYSSDKAYELIDFAYRVDETIHAFQVTLSESHSADPMAIRELAENAGGSNNLHLYYLVPSSCFANFVTKPANPVNAIRQSIKRDLALVRKSDKETRTKLQNEGKMEWTIRVFEVKYPREKQTESSKRQKIN